MVLSVDLGGTNLCLGLVDNGTVVNVVSVPSFLPSATMEQTLEYLAEQISCLMNPSVEKIGIGVPSVVDVERGIVYDAANIPSWKEVHLKSFLEERFGLPVFVNNDANCYAMGAYGTYPAEAKPEVLVTVTLGTGIGIGIVDHGRLFCGVNCGTGELGYLDYKDSCLEEYCSRQFFDKHGVKPHEVSAAAQAGENDPCNANNGGIQIKIFGDTGAYATDFFIGMIFIKTFFHNPALIFQSSITHPTELADRPLRRIPIQNGLCAFR